ncbi:MAG TPA: hypothetical protein DHU96_04185 [Actinobacteria bacterium]|nr:hypothetical protein [Actinomycetota bacterium]
MWSTTKAMTSLCAHLLIGGGELDPDAPVARYWPEFAGGGKGDIPVRWIMSHKSGLTGWRCRSACRTTTTGKRSQGCSPGRSRCSRRERPAGIRRSPSGTWPARSSGASPGRAVASFSRRRSPGRSAPTSISGWQRPSLAAAASCRECGRPRTSRQRSPRRMRTRIPPRGLRCSTRR